MSNSLRRLTIPVATALALGASALPAAARHDSDSAAPPPTQLPSLPSAGGQDANIAALQQTASPPNVVTVRVTKPDGFDWGDAGIGAGAGVAMLLIGIGGTAGVVRYRHLHAPMVG